MCLEMTSSTRTVMSDCQSLNRARIECSWMMTRIDSPTLWDEPYCQPFPLWKETDPYIKVIDCFAYENIVFWFGVIYISVLLSSSPSLFLILSLCFQYCGLFVRLSRLCVNFHIVYCWADKLNQIRIGRISQNRIGVRNEEHDQCLDQYPEPGSKS